MENSSDEQLALLAISKNQAAETELVKRYLKPLYGFCYRYVLSSQDAEDLAQEVFLKVWKNLNKFKQEQSFKAWIFSIAKNTCIDYLRKKKALSFSQLNGNEDEEEDFASTIADPQPLPDELFDRANLAGDLKKVLDSLPVNYNLVLLLHYQNDFTFKQIGEILGHPLDTVKSWHRRALNLVRKSLLKK